MKIVRIQKLNNSYENNFLSDQKYVEFLIERLNKINELIDSLFIQSIEIECLLRDEINLNNHRNYVNQQILESSKAKDVIALDAYLNRIHKLASRDDKIIPEEYLHDNFNDLFQEKRSNTQKIENLKSERSRVMTELNSTHINSSDYSIASYKNNSVFSINSKKRPQKTKKPLVVKFKELE